MNRRPIINNERVAMDPQYRIDSINKILQYYNNHPPKSHYNN